MRADRDFAQRGPGTMLAAGVDGGGAFRADLDRAACFANESRARDN